MQLEDTRIQPHHAAAAAMWGKGGRFYDEVSFAISDALAHAAQRLNARAGQAILDVATGTGWSARNAARGGAKVTAVDISAELVAAARELSAHVRPSIDFHVADAEALPFADASFDGVISTFGVMFALDQAGAARELARVCRPGGRLVLTAWVPDGSVAEFFAILGKYGDAPPPRSPLTWGDPLEVERLLGRDFRLVFETGRNHAHHDDAEDLWGWYSRGFGPLRQLIETLEPAAGAALKAEVDAYHRHYVTEAGLRIPRDYLTTIGRRR